MCHAFLAVMKPATAIASALLLASLIQGCGSPSTKMHPAPSHFTLELYFERESDHAFVDDEAARLIALVAALAPHIDLEVLTSKATAITRVLFDSDGTRHDVPNQAPSKIGRQALLITNEDIGAEGWAGRVQGCLSKQRMEKKRMAGADSADITIHEWLHTIEGLEINGRMIPHPHLNASFGFPNPSGRGPDGGDTWHSWYRYELRER
jgi:hypothetical protein